MRGNADFADGGAPVWLLKDRTSTYGISLLLFAGAFVAGTVVVFELGALD